MAKILIVEDDKQIRMAIAESLMDEGFEVEQVSNGEEAMKLVQGGKIGLVYLDIMMPEMDGYEVLRRIKADEKYFDLPVVMLSNLGQMKEIDTAMELGAKDYLIKANVDLNKMLEITKKYLRE